MKQIERKRVQVQFGVGFKGVQEPKMPLLSPGHWASEVICCHKWLELKEHVSFVRRRGPNLDLSLSGLCLPSWFERMNELLRWHNLQGRYGLLGNIPGPKWKATGWPPSFEKQPLPESCDLGRPWVTIPGNSE